MVALNPAYFADAEAPLTRGGLGHDRRNGTEGLGGFDRTQPKNRVGDFFCEQHDCTEVSHPAALIITIEIHPYRYDPASGCYKYLYVHANPTTYVDPSGNEFTLPSMSTVTGLIGNLARTVVTSITRRLGQASLSLGSRLLPGAPTGVAKLVGSFYLIQAAAGTAAGISDQFIRYFVCDTLKKGEFAYVQTMLTKVVTLIARLHPLAAAAAVGTGNGESVVKGGILAYHIRKVGEPRSTLDSVLMTKCRVKLVWLLPTGVQFQDDLPDII